MKGGATHLLYRIGVEALGAALHCKFSHKPRKLTHISWFFWARLFGYRQFWSVFPTFWQRQIFNLVTKIKSA